MRRLTVSTLSRWLCLALLWGLGGAASPAWALEAPAFTILADSAFLRSAPSVQAPATYSVFQGQVFAITGRTADNSWLQLDYPRATKGTWASAVVGKVTGDLGSVPVIQADPATSTPAASATVRPTPTTTATGLCEICVLLYNDTNGNGMHETNEGAIAGGQLMLLDTRTGAVLQTYTTGARDRDGHCFTDLSAARYTVAATAPKGYNATTEASISLQAQAGEQYQLTFGAQPGAGAPASGGAPDFRMALLGALGIVFFLLAAGLMAAALLRRK